MADEYWVVTQQCFEQLFSKPKMTQKLLTKPPFRYLHDIFTATMEATNFGQGLYNEGELDAKAITDKDGKMNFLSKLITLVELCIGEEIDVKPAKIVAGHEPEKTNLLLQCLFKAATTIGENSGPYVARVLGQDGGEEEPQQQDNAAEDAAQQEALMEQQR